MSSFLAILCVGIAAAAEVDDLYEAQVPVSGQAEAERLRALAEAFEAVLVKVTGRRDVVSDPGIAPALRRPMSYVQQYRYTPLPPEDESPYTESMRVQFDPRAIDVLVQGAGVPLWGRERPATLLWVAVDEGDRRYLLGADDQEDLREQLIDEAGRRGLPVLFPLLDLEDRRALSFADVWGNFAAAVSDASMRYQVPAVAVGRLLRERDGHWSARWSLYHEGNAEHWSVPAGEASAALAGGVDAVTDALAARYARSSPGGSGVHANVMVGGVGSLADYRRVLRYLERLDQVRELAVVAVGDGHALFRVRVDGDAATLARTIAFGKTLVAAPADGALSAIAEPEVPALSYRLLP
jgi:hypothetical protein